MRHYFIYKSYIERMSIYEGRELLKVLHNVPDDLTEQTKLFNNYLKEEGRI